MQSTKHRAVCKMCAKQTTRSRITFHSINAGYFCPLTYMKEGIKRAFLFLKSVWKPKFLTVQGKICRISSDIESLLCILPAQLFFHACRSCLGSCIVLIPVKSSAGSQALQASYWKLCDKLSLSCSLSFRQHSQWHPLWQRVPAWHSVHIWATWAQRWVWCLSCCPALPCSSPGVLPVWQPWEMAPPHKNMCAQTSWRYAASVQLLCFYVLWKNAERWLLIGAPTCPARFAENSSAGTAREVRTTAATLTPWRRAWWTATRTRSLSAWTILKAAAAETSASTSTLQLTCRPESRLHSTKPVKTPRPQAWWVVLDTVSLYFLTKISIKIFSCFSEEKHACKPTVKQANLCHTAKSIICWTVFVLLLCLINSTAGLNQDVIEVWTFSFHF